MGLLYTNNFRGRAGRRERAKHLVDEFKAIEDAFTRLQALNINTYLTTYVNTTVLQGTVTIRPDNGYLQELTLTSDVALQIAPPLNESQYRVSLLIHGGNYKITNLWGAQTWKEYGQGNWWELYTGDGPYASALLDFFWDICSHTWICVASTKNKVDQLLVGTEQRLYPLQCNLANTAGDDTLGFTRTDHATGIDLNQAFHYFPTDTPRFYGSRQVENWVATASDLTSLAWVPTDVTVTTDAGAGPASEDVQRLSFDVTGGKLSHFILPSFGRASTRADDIKVVVSFKGRGVSAAESVRVVCAFMGKTELIPPVHDIAQVSMDTTWQSYSAVLNVTKEDNATTSLVLDREYPRTLMEISLMSPSGSTGGDIQITDFQIEVMRADDEEIAGEIQDSTIGPSIALSGTGTGTWVDGTKTLTLASVGQSVDLSSALEIGKTYLVHPRLTAGDAADIRLQNEITVWAAGPPADDLYLQDAPFTFQYDGGSLKFVLLEGVSSIYLVDVYEVSNDRGVSCYNHDGTPVTSGILDGVAREITSDNEIPFNFFRTFTNWDQVGLSGIDVNDCRNPVFQSEYGIDGWPARASILQGASRVSEGFVQRVFSITPTTGGKDFQMWIRRSLDEEGNQIYTPQHNDVTTPLSRYVDFEAELIGGVTPIESGRVRLDIQTGDFVGLPSGYNYRLGIFEWSNWWHIILQLTNDGTHDTFRVRVYPASADSPDPSVIDVTQQGWVVIDWAQFEDTGGTYLGSSPIVGGETRSTEEFTSGLPDGDFYRQENQLNAGDAGHVATLTAGSLIWDDDDGVYKNLLYSSDVFLADPNVRNMHEFGLVEADAPPAVGLTLLTTTLYPVEVTETVEMGGDIVSGSLTEVPEEEYDTDSDLVSITLDTILLSYPGDEEQYDTDGELRAITLETILITYPGDEEEYDTDGDLVSISVIDKLVPADTPDERLEMGGDVVPSGCSLTPI